MTYSDNYGYNNQVADVVRPLGQGRVLKTTNGFRSIDNVEIGSNAVQNRIRAGDISTGQMRGTQRIKGQIQIVDSNGQKVMIMGYQKGQF